MTTAPEYVPDSGASIVSNNILTGRGVLTWLLREEPMNPQDNGWRFLSNIDDDDYINNPDNLQVRSFNTIADIEPAIIGIYGLPVGTDLQLVTKFGRKRFIDNLTGKKITVG